MHWDCKSKRDGGGWGGKLTEVTWYSLIGHGKGLDFTLGWEAMGLWVQGVMRYALLFKRLNLPLEVLRIGCRKLGRKQGDPLGGCCNNPEKDDGGLN